MHLILRQTGTDSQEIEVTGSLFAVGRSEPPFADFDRTKVARLSKRHARLFEQDGRCYIADLGSTNGTFLNGKRLQGEPKVIVNGDLLSFGGLEYELETAGPLEPVAGRDALVRLALTPEYEKNLLEPLVISSFPFLVNKYSDAFSRYQEELPDDLSFISRRHAHFFLREEDVYLEDLGSTNGTFVSGDQLDEHARRLEDGDIVAFGGDRFVYRVHILASSDDDTTELSQALEGVENPDRTIFIDSPTSFVDIYIGSQEPDPLPPDSDGEAVSDSAGTSRAAPKTRLGRGFRFLGALRSAVFGDQPVSNRARWILFGLVVLTAGGSGLYFWQGAELRRIESRLAAGDYLGTLQQADAYLATHPDAMDARRLATRATFEWLGEDWQNLVTQGAYDEAQDLVQLLADTGTHNSDDDMLLEILSWAIEVDAFLEAPPANQSLNRLLEDVSTLNRLVSWWDQGKRAYGRELLQVAAANSDFKPVRQAILSNVRHLQTREDDLQSIQALRAQLDKALSARDVAALQTALESYQVSDSSLELAELHQDVEQIEQIFEALNDARPMAAYALLSDLEFSTSPFIDHAIQLRESDLPDPETAAAYTAATRAWREGDTETAFETLGRLRAGRWGNEAGVLEDRYRMLLAGHEALLKVRGTPQFTGDLLAYHALLDPAADQFLAARLQADYESVTAEATAEAEMRLQEAETAWAQYEKLGGIDSDLRFEDQVSARFRQLAGLIGAAMEGLAEARRTYELSGAPPSTRWQTLRAGLCTEIKVQRDTLDNLRVAPQPVRVAKLALLPPTCPE